MEEVIIFQIKDKTVKLANNSSQISLEDISLIENYLNEIKQSKDIKQSLVKPPVPYTKQRWEKTSIPYMLSDYLIDEVCKRDNTYARYQGNPEHMELLTQKMCYSFDKMLHTDKIEAVELFQVLEWTQHHDFWAGNIRSSDKFREQYNVLTKQMKQEAVKDENPELTSEIIEAYRTLIANSQYNPSGDQKSKFIAASKKMIEFFVRTGIDQSYWVEYLLECLDKNYCNKGENVYPGTMCSDYTWNILMPQYMASTGLI